MTETQEVTARLIEAMKKLGVFSRIDEDGRILAFDGRQEWEVSVDLSRLLTRQVGGYLSREIAVGKSSLGRLEAGDVKALFPGGILPAEEIVADTPMAANYRPLEWSSDQNSLDAEQCLVAHGDDWTYRISPILGWDDEVIGYRIAGGDIESGEEGLGSSLIGGEPGELSLAKARAVAETNYAARYREAEVSLASIHR